MASNDRTDTTNDDFGAIFRWRWSTGLLPSRWVALRRSNATRP